jgi:hypothetical protein
VKVVLIRFILTSSGVLFLGSSGAFFLLAPMLSIATVALLLMGLMLMFWIGVQVGAQGMVPSESVGTRARCLIASPAFSSGRVLVEPEA